VGTPPDGDLEELLIWHFPPKACRLSPLRYRVVRRLLGTLRGLRPEAGLTPSGQPLAIPSEIPSRQGLHGGLEINLRDGDELEVIDADGKSVDCEYLWNDTQT